MIQTMQVQVADILSQLNSLLDELTDEEYCQPSQQLGNQRIGAHVRHIVALFQCLVLGYETGTVNYENRSRDKAIETERTAAITALTSIMNSSNLEDKEINIICFGDRFLINSNYYRELLYNIEHAIHHMALIRIGVNEISSISLPNNFGVAPSTIKYREECAQ
jgi:hypothetical protein